jgi:hypothetical protein
MTDLLVDAEDYLNRLPEAVSRRKLGEGLGGVLRTLSNSEQQIAKIAAFFELAKLLHFPTSQSDEEIFEDLRGCVEAMAKSLNAAENSDTLRKLEDVYTKEFNPAVTAYERAIREYWRNIISSQFRPLISIGELLNSMNVANNLGQRLRDCGQRAVDSNQRLDSATELRKLAFDLLVEYKELQAERAAQIAEDEVGDFINALLEKRATLSLVTPKVHAWLIKHNALDSLGVTTH